MKLLTIKDIMELYGVSKKTATRLAKLAGTVPRAKNMKIYVSQDRLEQFMKGF